MIRRSLALLLATALLAAIAPATALAAADDDPVSSPALPGASGSTSNTLLTPATDVDDWYNITLAEGDQLVLSLRGDAGTDLSLSLFLGSKGVGAGDELFFLWFWSGGYPRETSYVVPPGGAGTYYVQVHGTPGQGAAGGYTLTWARTHESVARLFGADRYQTAAAVSRSSFASATTAVIASGENYPDALAASGLAGVLNAPVLLTRKSYVPRDVAVELQRLGVSEIVIIGSPDAVSLDVEAELSGGTAGYVVDRIGGGNRYETARLVAERIKLLGGSREVFLVTGTKYADALSVASAAYARRMPVLLTRPDLLSPAASAALDSLDTTHAVIAGSTSAVGSVVASAAEDVCEANAGGPDYLLERWSGDDRYGTAASVAQHAAELGWTDWADVALATGWNFPDALGGGSAMGVRGGTLLLTDPRWLSAPAGDALRDHQAGVGRVYLLGSVGALPDGIRAEAAARLLP